VYYFNKIVKQNYFPGVMVTVNHWQQHNDRALPWPSEANRQQNKDLHQLVPKKEVQLENCPM
jgi:hypothetical protein